MKQSIKYLLGFILIPLAVGGLIGYLIKDNIILYQQLDKPLFSPPGFIFPIVWTVLYILMGIASYLIYISPAKKEDKSTALLSYFLQLFVNALWSIFFFVDQEYLFSFIWLLFLWVLILYTIILFYKISKTAAYLLIPYLVWVTFAGYLNLSIYLLTK